MRLVLVCLSAFCMSPFLLNSNLSVVVGLAKADRVVYLPLLSPVLAGRMVCRASCSTTDHNDNDDDSLVPNHHHHHKSYTSNFPGWILMAAAMPCDCGTPGLCPGLGPTDMVCLLVA